MTDLYLLALSLGLKAIAVIIVLLIVLPHTIRWSAKLDKRAGVNFRETIKIIDSNPLACALYRSARFGFAVMAVAIAVGLALG